MSDWDEIDKKLGKPETLADISQYIEKSHHSRFPLRTLGTGTDIRLYITEEDRETHTHILGATRTGKSKFLEMFLRHDLRNGYGAMLLDPSANGETAYKVLKYAISIGHEKIVLIDPKDSLEEKFGHKVVCFNPLHIFKTKEGKPIMDYAPAILTWVEDAFQITWGTKEEETTRISKYLPAVLQALYAADLTLAEAKYFMTPAGENARRDWILSHLHGFDLNRQYLESAFKHQSEYLGYQPTINQLNAINNPILEAMLGSKDVSEKERRTLNVQKFISEGYLILVNLNNKGVYAKRNQRILGSLLVNEVLRCIERLKDPTHHNPWPGHFYIYIDECQYYANPKVTEMLDETGKTGISLTLAHHGFDQFPKNVEGSVKRGTQIKALFRTGDVTDRRKMLDMIYYGDMPEKADIRAGRLPKGVALVRVGNQEPGELNVERIPDANVSWKQVDDWKINYYKQPNEWCRNKYEVYTEINERFKLSSSQFIRRDNVGRAKGKSASSTAGTGKGPDGDTGRKGAPVQHGQGEDQANPDPQAQQENRRDHQDPRIPTELPAYDSSLKRARRKRTGETGQGNIDAGGQS